MSHLAITTCSVRASFLIRLRCPRPRTHLIPSTLCQAAEPVPDSPTYNKAVTGSEGHRIQGNFFAHTGVWIEWNKTSLEWSCRHVDERTSSQVWFRWQGGEARSPIVRYLIVSQGTLWLFMVGERRADGEIPRLESDGPSIVGTPSGLGRIWATEWQGEVGRVTVSFADGARRYIDFRRREHYLPREAAFGAASRVVHRGRPMTGGAL